MNNNDIVVLLPAYNPTKDLISLVNGLIENNFKVLVVNDGSNEKSQTIFDKLNKDAIYIKHEQNMGKGKALKTGFEYVKNNINCLGVVTADADGQHLLKDIINVSKNISKEKKCLTLGSRLDCKNMPFKSKFGNTITRGIFKLATTKKVFDTQTGLRGIPFSLLDEFINIDGNRYEYEINMLLYCANNNIDIEEIKIETVYLNDNKASSFNGIKDSYKIYKCIFQNSNLKTIFLYAISAILSFLIDFTILLTLNKFIFNFINADISLLICVIVARAISSMFNFLFNRNIVFKSKSNFISDMLKYYSLVLFVIAINYLILDILAVKLNLNLSISKIIVEILMFINNYIIQKLFIFKKNKNN